MEGERKGRGREGGRLKWRGRGREEGGREVEMEGERER